MDYTIKIYQTKQYGTPEVTVEWSDDSRGVFDLQGYYARGNHIPTYLRGQYKLTEQDNAKLKDAISACAKTGDPQVLTFSTASVKHAPRSPEWRSPRGLTLAQEMESEDTDY